MTGTKSNSKHHLFQLRTFAAFSSELTGAALEAAGLDALSAFAASNAAAFPEKIPANNRETRKGR